MSEQMSFQMPDFSPAVPEIVLLTLACVLLVTDLFIRKEDKDLTYYGAQAVLFIVLVFVWMGASSTPEITFNGLFIRDSLSDLLNGVICIVSMGAFLYSRSYLKDRQCFQGEFYLLGLLAVLGMMVMVSAYSLLTLYMGLEIMSLSLYVMVALRRDSKVASEAAMKYFVLGAIASGLLLYGMSMLYGVSGSLNLSDIRTVVESNPNQPLLLLGLVFVLAGLAFKMGAVPFHMWVPDVYAGAPTAVTLFISTAPKIAAFAMMVRLLADGLAGMAEHWQPLLMSLSVLSLVVGNIVAIAQTNLKRMLAYSGISHAGFLLLGLLTASNTGYASSMFYVISYAVMGLAAFGMILLLSRRGFESEEISDFKGLNEKSPWFAFMMLIVMFSMAGVPPSIGFFAKFSVLQEVVSNGFVGLAIVAVIFSVIGAFYYLRVIKMMYFDVVENEKSSPVAPVQMDVQLLMTGNAVLILLMGVFPDSLLNACSRVWGI
jgi:NADH-quinone oxidoreductase subunit N